LPVYRYRDQNGRMIKRRVEIEERDSQYEDEELLQRICEFNIED
jgi:hypothetical protein